MKFVIVAYLRNVKGYHYPFDIYFCRNYSAFLSNCEKCHRLVEEGRYCNFETYIQRDIPPK